MDGEIGGRQYEMDAVSVVGGGSARLASSSSTLRLRCERDSGGRASRRSSLSYAHSPILRDPRRQQYLHLTAFGSNTHLFSSCPRHVPRSRAKPRIFLPHLVASMVRPLSSLFRVFLLANFGGNLENLLSLHLLNSRCLIVFFA